MTVCNRRFYVYIVFLSFDRCLPTLKGMGKGVSQSGIQVGQVQRASTTPHQALTLLKRIEPSVSMWKKEVTKFTNFYMNRAIWFVTSMKCQNYNFQTKHNSIWRKHVR